MAVVAVVAVTIPVVRMEFIAVEVVVVLMVVEAVEVLQVTVRCSHSSQESSPAWRNISK